MQQDDGNTTAPGNKAKRDNVLPDKDWDFSTVIAGAPGSKEWIAAKTIKWAAEKEIRAIVNRRKYEKHLERRRALKAKKETGPPRWSQTARALTHKMYQSNAFQYSTAATILMAFTLDICESQVLPNKGTYTESVFIGA